MRIIRKKKPVTDTDDDDPGQVITHTVDDFRASPSKTLFADFTITSRYGALLKNVENGGCPLENETPSALRSRGASEPRADSPPPPNSPNGGGFTSGLTTLSKTPIPHAPNRLPVGCIRGPSLTLRI